MNRRNEVFEVADESVRFTNYRMADFSEEGNDISN
jgi:hypothetical protein